MVDIKKRLYAIYANDQDPVFILERASLQHSDGTTFILIPETLR